MIKIALIGATGSIGTQTLSVIDKHPDEFELYSAAAGHGSEKFAEIIRRYRPKIAAVADKKSGETIRGALPQGTAFYCGEKEALEVFGGADVALVAASGFAGLSYSFAAARLGMPVALANKETLVCGGEYFMGEAQKHGAEIRPVDSEHSALWQALNFRRDTPFRRLLITASGGPFYSKTAEELQSVTAADALKHPTWNMGAKITIDSATLLNKGFEVIEAHHRGKIDAPSGTALMLADAAKEARDAANLDTEYVYERSSKREKRGDAEIGISSIRGGTIVGEHSVIFAGNNEVLTLSHSAESRDLFGTGAIRAALFIANKPAGFYTMSDVIAEIL